MSILSKTLGSPISEEKDKFFCPHREKRIMRPNTSLKDTREMKPSLREYFPLEQCFIYVGVGNCDVDGGGELCCMLMT